MGIPKNVLIPYEVDLIISNMFKAYLNFTASRSPLLCHRFPHSEEYADRTLENETFIENFALAKTSLQNGTIFYSFSSQWYLPSIFGWRSHQEVSYHRRDRHPDGTSIFYNDIDKSARSTASGGKKKGKIERAKIQPAVIELSHVSSLDGWF